MQDDNNSKLNTNQIKIHPPGRIVILLILMPILISCLLAPFNLSEQVSGAIAVGSFFLAVMYFSARRVDSRRRWLYFAFVLPGTIGFILFIYLNEAIAPLLIGLGITIALTLGNLGYYVLRSPAEYRKAAAMYLKAMRMYRKREYTEALELASSAIQEKPEQWQHYKLRSMIQLGLYQFENARCDAQKAIELNPEGSSGYLALGRVETTLQNYDEANAAFARAIELSPKSPVNHYYMGATLYRQEQYEEAESYLTTALRGSLRSDWQRMLAYLYLGNCLLNLGDTKRASEVLENLRYQKRVYEWMRKEIENTPDRPNIVALRQDLDEIRQYVSAKQ